LAVSLSTPAVKQQSSAHEGGLLRPAKDVICRYFDGDTALDE